MQVEEGTGSGVYTGRRRAVSLALLIVVNVLPLLGVLYLDWDVLSLMILYWSENLVLGFYTLARMLVKSPIGGLGMGAFFCIHYGGFCAGHGLFILTMLAGIDFDPTPGEPWPLFLIFIQMLVGVVREVLSMAPPAWMLAFIALYISHGASFILNFLLGKEKDALSLNDLMKAPYKRIVILHIAVIAGGGLAQAMGQPLFMLLALIVLKLAVDIKLHLREHRA